MSENKSAISKVWSVASTVLVVIVVLVAVFLMGSRIMGYRVFTVISGSMEPAYSVGDLIYVKNTEPKEIKVGDAITYVMNENLVVSTHRVVKIEQKNGEFMFYTKGDANKDADKSPVHNKNVVGVVKFSIPYLGYVSDWVQNPPGMYIAIALGVILIIAVFLPDIIKSGRDKDGKKHNVEEAPVAEIPFEETAVVENESVPQTSEGDVKISEEKQKEE